MRRRESTFLALGLVVGLLFGVALSGTSVIQNLMGTAGADSVAESKYYLVDFATAREWLLESQAGEPTATSDGDEAVIALSDAFTQVETLPTADNFRQELRGMEAPITSLLSHTYRAISGNDVPATVQDIRAEFHVACLGMDDDPYNDAGPVLSLYVKLPEADVSRLPDGAQVLDAPKENDLYWQLLACQPAPNSS